MKLKQDPPCLRKDHTVTNMMYDLMLTLSVLLILPVIYHGWRPVLLTLATGTVCYLCEIFCCLLQRKNIDIHDPSSFVTGMVIAMLLPVTAPYWLAAAAGAFAILVAKGPFGGTGRNPFNPAAAGIAFVILCWPGEVFSYLGAGQGSSLPLFADCRFSAVDSPAATLKSGLKPGIMPLQMLWGGFVGPMGTTSILIIAACASYLVLRRTANWEIMAFYFLTAGLIAALSPRIACNWLVSVKYELMSGSLFFCGVFMMSDPVTSPRTSLGHCVYGALGGALVMAFRHFGAYEQGACFAVLLCNALTPVIDRGVCLLRETGNKIAGGDGI